MTGGPLELRPRLCDRCGRCYGVCPTDALSVGRTYLKVDWTRCDGCGACARACLRHAIVLKDAPGRAKTASSAKGKGSARGSAADARPRPVARQALARTAKTGAHAAPSRMAGSSRTRVTSGAGAVPFAWTLLEAVAILSVTFAAFALKEALAESSWLQSVPSALDILASAGLLALYYALQVMVLMVLVSRRRGDVLSALHLRRKHGSFKGAMISTALVIGSLFVVRLGSSLYTYATRALGKLPATSIDLPALFGSDAAGFVLAVLMVVIIGPVVEEAVFRAALLEGLAAKFGIWPGILAQAAVFAALHRSLWLLLPMFVLGIVLGWLAYRRESLWPPIVLHALYNAITVAAAFFVAGTV